MRKLLIGLASIVALSSLSISQVKNDYEAKAWLTSQGIGFSQIVERAEFIIIASGQVRPFQGIPLIGMVQPEQVIYLPGTSGYVTSKRTVFIECDRGFGTRLCGVILGKGVQKSFVVGQSLTDIVNFLMRE